MKTLLLGAACAGMLALTACDAAPVMGVETLAKVDAQALDAMQDTLAKTEIVQLAHAYGFARDNYDGQAYANVFAADGVFTFRGEDFVGREAIASRVPNKADTNNVSMHIIATSHVQLTGPKTATGQHYGMVYVGEYAEGAPKTGAVPGRIGSRGVYTDSYKLTNEGWKIATRSYSPIFTAP